jgi:hypothetical protein
MMNNLRTMLINAPDDIEIMDPGWFLSGKGSCPPGWGQPQAEDMFCEFGDSRIEFLVVFAGLPRLLKNRSAAGVARWRKGEG